MPRTKSWLLEEYIPGEYTKTCGAHTPAKMQLPSNTLPCAALIVWEKKNVQSYLKPLTSAGPPRNWACLARSTLSRRPWPGPGSSSSTRARNATARGGEAESRTRARNAKKTANRLWRASLFRWRICRELGGSSVRAAGRFRASSQTEPSASATLVGQS